jgi:hypothetical protein
MANVTVNATISARDAASKNIKTVNKALGNLGKTAGNIGNDFKKVAFGIGAIAAGIGAFTVSAIREAAADQAAAAKLTSALAARGFATAEVTKAVEAQIKAGQKLAFTDDEVRASVEASTRFTNDYAVAQKMQTVAMDLARTTGMTLADATIAVGRAYTGTGGRVLKALGITEKSIKGQEALDAILGKTEGSAEAYADTLEGSFATLAIGAAELKEQFGDAFLPAVTKLFKGLAPYMDRFSALITKITPKLQRFADIVVQKILDKIPSLFAEFEANVPKALIGFEQFIDKITGVGKTAENVLGKDGPIRVAITAIGAAFGGLKGAIAANLVKDGMDPFTALIVANIAAQVPASLAAALTGQIVTKAVAAFGASVAAASAGGAAASAAAGVGGTAASGGLTALLGAAFLPVSILAISVAAAAALSNAITEKGMTDKVGGNGVVDIFGTTAATTAGGGFDLGEFWRFVTTGQRTPTTPAGPMSGATTNNIFIGTGKVDTVITDSINRTGTFKRGR